MKIRTAVRYADRLLVREKRIILVSPFSVVKPKLGPFDHTQTDTRLGKVYLSCLSVFVSVFGCGVKIRIAG